MRILHVSDCYLPRVGGIELHVRDLAARQRGLGHDVTVVTRTPPAPGSEHDDGVRRVRAGQRAQIAQAAPDVLHAHVSIVSPFALGTARRAAELGVPTVITVHSLWEHVGPLPEIARHVWGMSDWDVTWSAVSERAAQPVRDLLGVEVAVVPNAVDLEEWSPAPGPLPTGVPTVVSVMRLTTVKRAIPFARIIREAASRADLRVTVVGEGPERAAMQRYLHRHGLSDRVTLTGTLERPAIRRHLEGASVFVAPAHRESFGIAALEARATGVPVLASAQSGIATFVEHGRDGLLAEDDAGLAELLVGLLTDKKARDRIARHNRLVPPRYGWVDALARNEDAYGSAMSRHRGRRSLTGGALAR